jgi:hypothetical protein
MLAILCCQCYLRSMSGPACFDVPCRSVAPLAAPRVGVCEWEQPPSNPLGPTRGPASSSFRTAYKSSSCCPLPYCRALFALAIGVHLYTLPHCVSALAAAALIVCAPCCVASCASSYACAALPSLCACLTALPPLFQRHSILDLTFA